MTNNDDSIKLNELLGKIREKKNKTNIRQRANYLKRKEEGRNKQLKKPEDHLKRGPKTGKTKPINIDNNLLIINSILLEDQNTTQNENKIIISEM
jgi:hypothetical protein